MPTPLRLSFGLVIAGALLAFSPDAHAAPPQQVNGWNGGKTFPSDVSMYVYLPTQLAAKPPIVTLVHYCGGTAQAVFGQAQGGGLVEAADKYGFIMVIPSSGRCWDVTSKKSQTRDGGGDTHAIAQMVTYALTQYSANADRVYSTGDSSGGMMTQLLMALYPDVFKGGSAFAGVPAGCSNEFDGAGLCGVSSQTAQQWGDRVRAMYPGYNGHRPRVQLFHGDKDATIKYQNFLESVKEWTNVLGLPAEPTTTDMNVPLGQHMAKRQRWKNQCGVVVLDAFTSQFTAAKDGQIDAHGPSDALFEADYVVPFLGLDDTGPVDPEIKQCSGAGAGGTGGNGSGGGAVAGAGGAGAGAGGVPGVGGAPGGSAGASGTSGGSAGTTSGGSNSPMAGAGVTGGFASGGMSAGQAEVAGSAASAPSDDAAGCGCRVGGGTSRNAAWVLSALGLALGWRRRRSR